MKKQPRNLIAALFMLLVFNGFSQCDIPAYIPSFAHELMLDPSANFNTHYSFENGLNTKYYSPNCGVGTISFDYKTTKGNAQLQMYLELWKTTFDCNGNVVGSDVLVTTTPTVTYGTGSNSNLTVSIDNIAFEANTYYRVKANRRIKFIFWGTWGYEWSNNARFIAPANLPTPDGSFVTSLSTDTRTSTGTGWSIDVHQLDINSALDFNASATSCETMWSYTVSEFDLNPWTTTNTVSSGWINGQAGTIDLDAFYTGGLQRGQVYVIQLVAGPGWNVEYFFFEIKDATIGGSISNNGSVSEVVYTKGGHATFYTLFEQCNTAAVILNTAGTSSEDEYNISMQAIDANYNDVSGFDETGWTSGQAPATFNTGSLFSPVLGQRYKLTYEVGNPVQTKVFYFRTKYCKNSGKMAGSDAELIPLEASAYPNPTAGRFTVTIGNEESFNVAVYDVMGQLIVDFNDVEGDLDLDLTKRGPGVYLIKMTQGAQVVTKRVIVK